MQETTTQLMQQALHWCHRDESMGGEFLQACFERYMREKHGYVCMHYPPPAEFNTLGVAGQRSLLKKWKGLEDAVNFELLHEKFDFQASTISLNGTRAAILTGMFFKAANMAHNLHKLTSKCCYEHLVLANIIMKLIRLPEQEKVTMTTVEMISELQYWHDSATYFVERPLTCKPAQTKKDSKWQYEELKHMLLTEYVLAFLCCTSKDLASLVKLLNKDLLSLVVSSLLHLS
jgi:hypothetical protein